jgi:hypothetical protein
MVGKRLPDIRKRLLKVRERLPDIRKWLLKVRKSLRNPQKHILRVAARPPHATNNRGVAWLHLAGHYGTRANRINSNRAA